MVRQNLNNSFIPAVEEY